MNPKARKQQTDIVDETREPTCGNKDCKVSVDIFREVFTFGSGRLNQFGTWQYPCTVCEDAYLKSLRKE